MCDFLKRNQVETCRSGPIDLDVLLLGYLMVAFAEVACLLVASRLSARPVLLRGLLRASLVLNTVIGAAIFLVLASLLFLPCQLFPLAVATLVVAAVLCLTLVWSYRLLCGLSEIVLWASSFIDAGRGGSGSPVREARGGV